jgi:hypothetical protein
MSLEIRQNRPKHREIGRIIMYSSKMFLEASIVSSVEVGI